MSLGGEGYFIEDPRGRFCQYYTEVSIIIVYCEREGIVRTGFMYYSMSAISRFHRDFNFYWSSEVGLPAKLNQERPSMQYLSCSRNRYGTYIKSRSFHSTSLAHRLSGTQHMYPLPLGGTRENGRKNRWPLQPPACYIDYCYLPKDVTTKIRSTSKIKYCNSSRSWRVVKTMGTIK